MATKLYFFPQFSFRINIRKQRLSKCWMAQNVGLTTKKAMSPKAHSFMSKVGEKCVSTPDGGITT